MSVGDSMDTNKNDHKNKKNKALSFVGTLLIIIGLSMIIYSFGSTYLEKRAIDKEMQAFFDAPMLTDDDDFVMPDEAHENELWRLEIEKLDIDHPVIQSSNWDYLNRYLVAWDHSPVPPKKGNFSIAGHNGRCASCVFRNFDRLEIGDEVKISDREFTYIYEITNIFEVIYTDVSVLEDTPEETTLTLVTCTKQVTYDEYRTIVKAKLVDTIEK